MSRTETWADRFRMAIQSDPESLLGRSVAEVIDDEWECAEGVDQEVDIARVVLKELAAVLVKSASDGYCMTQRSDSPIEAAMYWALILEGERQSDALVVRGGTLTSGEITTRRPWCLTIEQQVPLGKYRVDFLLTSRARWSFDEYAEAQVIVECDGHDYHERTREQARRDKERDRALQALGMRVLRFTGSEIWRDPLACAREAIGQADRAATQQLHATWGTRGQT